MDPWKTYVLRVKEECLVECQHKERRFGAFSTILCYANSGILLSSLTAMLVGR